MKVMNKGTLPAVVERGGMIKRKIETELENQERKLWR